MSLFKKSRAKTEHGRKNEGENLTTRDILGTKLNAMTVDELKRSFTLKGAVIAEAIVIMLLLAACFHFQKKAFADNSSVIIINGTSGESVKMKNAITNLSDFTAPEYLMANTLKTYVTKLRSVSNDDGVNEENIKWIYSFSTEKAADYVRDFYNRSNPMDRHNKDHEKVEITIYNYLPVNSANGLKFQMDWNETVRDLDGRFKAEQNYRADIDMKQFKATAATAERNPAGMYVTSINISRIEEVIVKNR